MSHAKGDLCMVMPTKDILPKDRAAEVQKIFGSIVTLVRPSSLYPGNNLWECEEFPEWHLGERILRKLPPLADLEGQEDRVLKEVVTC